MAITQRYIAHLLKLKIFVKWISLQNLFVSNFRSNINIQAFSTWQIPNVVFMYFFMYWIVFLFAVANTHKPWLVRNRSSRPRVLCKKGYSKKDFSFNKFAGRNFWKNFFWKVLFCLFFWKNTIPLSDCI